jgi:hybrid cluster-associated redox disulfide protein
MTTQKIIKNMNISEVIEKYPDAIQVFLMYGLSCIGCGFSEFETIEEGAKGHGMDDELIDIMIEDANKVIDGIEKGEISLD